MSEDRGTVEALPSLGPKTVGLALAAVVLWYGFGTLPYLGDFPRPDWAEMGIAAPAYKLATQGVYGNDLFTGFYRSETYNYEYMPAYPLLVALSFKLFGLGVVQARLVSVFCGLLTLGLTFLLGRRVLGSAVGVTAAAVLVALRLGLVPGTSGVPLMDFSRLVRYDVLVPVFVLAGCVTFEWARRRQDGGAARARWGFLLSGLFCGLATLSHVYGAFVLALFVALFLWERGLRALGHSSFYLVLAGWLAALLPWVLYLLQDPAAYVGQMSRHEGRFELLDLSFYWDNLMREYGRYGSWAGGDLRTAFLTPRVGIWLFLIGVPAAWGLLWRRVRQAPRPGPSGDRLLLLSLPVMALLLGLLVHVKRYVYVTVLLPFIALYVALALVSLCRYSGRFHWRGRLTVALVGVLAVAEGGAGVAAHVGEGAQGTRYQEVTESLRSLVPPRARVLISQPYWLGLADYDTRSINLILQLSRFGGSLAPETPPGALSAVEDKGAIGKAMGEVDPDYVVVESFFVDPVSKDPRALDPDHRFYPWFQELGAYLDRHCPGVTVILEASDYGELRVYCCPGSGGRNLCQEAKNRGDP